MRGVPRKRARCIVTLHQNPEIKLLTRDEFAGFTGRAGPAEAAAACAFGFSLWRTPFAPLGALGAALLFGPGISSFLRRVFSSFSRMSAFP